MNGGLRLDMLTRGELDRLDQALEHDSTAPVDDTIDAHYSAAAQRVATHNADGARRRRPKLRNRK